MYISISFFGVFVSRIRSIGKFEYIVTVIRMKSTITLDLRLLKTNITIVSLLVEKIIDIRSKIIHGCRNEKPH